MLEDILGINGWDVQATRLVIYIPAKCSQSTLSEMRLTIMVTNIRQIMRIVV